ncbi:MAG: hypothetical protein M3162_08080 [Thermoproteota archaeon]|nr:hypothetical protein [Thermoproteota archaeon]
MGDDDDHVNVVFMAGSSQSRSIYSRSCLDKSAFDSIHHEPTLGKESARLARRY